MLELISQKSWFEVYGAENWKKYPKISYKGKLPNTKSAVIENYRERGVGFALQSAYFVHDDSISNRLFEINSAGSVVIAGHMPFIEKYYKDTVLYFDPYAPQPEIAKQVDEHMIWIKKNPDQALEKALAAQKIFHDQLSMEVYLNNLIDYHLKAKKDSGFEVVKKKNLPTIGVIIRTGGRNFDHLRRALDSIQNQTYKNVVPVIVIYKHATGLIELIDSYRPMFPRLDIVESISSLRSTSLWAGLNHVKNQSYEYFGILDDDDEYFPNFLMSMYNFVQQAQLYTNQKVELVFCMAASESPIKQYHYSEIRDNRTIPKVPTIKQSVREMLGDTFTNASFCKTCLLDDIILRDPTMQTAEDTYLFYCLGRKTIPFFNPRVLALVHEDTGSNSMFEVHPNRQYDVLKLKTEFFGQRFATGELISGDIMTNEIQYPNYVVEAHLYGQSLRYYKFKQYARRFIRKNKSFLLKYIATPIRYLIGFLRSLYNLK